MGRCRVVLPETVRLPLSDGDYLDIKKELNAGEYVDFLTEYSQGKFFAKPLAYVIGWSLVGPVGPLPYSLELSVEARRDTLRALDEETMHEIVNAIDQHTEAHAAEKNDDGRRARIVTDLVLCRVMHMSYDDVRALPLEVYQVAIDELNREHADRERDEERARDEAEVFG